MGVWSVGILDTGITDEAQDVIGGLRSWDFFYKAMLTQMVAPGTSNRTHHDWVAREIYKVNPKLERIDYQISSNYETINHPVSDK